jgi:hypothetical protein
MRTSPLILSLTAAAVTSAQFYNETSAPFHLLVTSNDGCINDTLSTCHVGAALESLCLSSGNTTSSPNLLDAEVFNFNTSTYSQAPEPELGVPGILTWFLPTTIGDIPSSVEFNHDPTSNLALPILNPGSDNPTQLAFDKNERLTVQGYIDHSVAPPNGRGNWTEYYRWFACDTYFSSYIYRNLAWGLGPQEPENPSCVAVNVTRVFV